MSEVIKEVGQLFDAEFKSRDLKYTYSISLSLKIARILADKSRLRQVMINLVSNAIKFTSTMVKVEVFTFTVSEPMRPSRSVIKVSLKFS